MEPIKKYIGKRVSAFRAKLAGIPGNPRKVSLGYSLGVFLAATPLIGVKVPIAILLTSLFKWNKIASVIGVFHVNLLTAPLFYGFSFLVGQFVLQEDTGTVLPDDFTVKACIDLFTENYRVFLALLAGGFVLGVPMAIAAYFFCFSVILRNHKTQFCGFSYSGKNGRCRSSESADSGELTDFKIPLP
jgi:uncharacterized protein (DUF2062 family)